MNNNFERFVSDELVFEDSIEKKSNNIKRSVDDYLKKDTIVKLKIMNGEVIIRGVWKLKNGKLYDYVGNRIISSNDHKENNYDEIFFNEDDILRIESVGRSF